MLNVLLALKLPRILIAEQLDAVRIRTRFVEQKKVGVVLTQLFLQGWNMLKRPTLEQPGAHRDY